MRILVAEDDDGFSRLLREILSAVPEFEATFCANGLEAWWHLTQPDKTYDLGIFDITMPHVDGLTLLSRVRSHPQFAQFPVIICTGMSTRQKIAEAGQLRATHYVIKPFPPSTLIEKIKGIEQTLHVATKEIRIV